MFGMGPSELVIVGIIAVLLFGKRLPEVAKSLGSSYREFRKGLTSLQSEVDLGDINSYGSSTPASSFADPSYDDFDDQDEATAPKFEPPPSEPREEQPTE